MDVWEYLGIEITSDISIIKRAYASLLKKYPPETHPDEFMLLRSAYEDAIKFAKTNSKVISLEKEEEENFLEMEDFPNEPELINSDLIEHEEYTVSQSDFVGSVIIQDVPRDISRIQKNDYEVAQSLFEEMKNLLVANKKKRLFKPNLKPKLDLIFAHPDMWNLNVKEIFEGLLFEFLAQDLSTKKPLKLPNRVWLHIDQFFAWKEREIKLYKAYPYEQVNSVLQPIRTASKQAIQLKSKGNIKKAVISSAEIESGVIVETKSTTSSWISVLGWIGWYCLYKIIRFLVDQ